MVYLEGITPEWKDVPPREQVKYLKELRMRWKQYLNYGHSGVKELNAFSWSIPRALMQKEIDLREHHKLPKMGRKSNLLMNRDWAWNTGARMPFALQLLRGIENVFMDNPDMEEEFFFDLLDIQISMEVCQETFDAIRGERAYVELLPFINENTRKMKSNPLNLNIVADSLHVSNYPVTE